MTEPEPLAVYDVLDPAFKNMPADQHAALVEWIRAQSINPEESLRLEVHGGERPFARVTHVMRTETGAYALDLELNEAKRQDPFDVPISSLPPGVIGGAR